MLVVSQNKEIITCAFCCRYEVDNDGGVYVTDQTEKKQIAKYDRIEKAKFAVQKLWSAYANNQRVFIMPE